MNHTYFFNVITECEDKEKLFIAEYVEQVKEQCLGNKTSIICTLREGVLIATREMALEYFDENKIVKKYNLTIKNLIDILYKNDCYNWCKNLTEISDDLKVYYFHALTETEFKFTLVDVKENCRLDMHIRIHN